MLTFRDRSRARIDKRVNALELSLLREQVLALYTDQFARDGCIDSR